MSGLRMGFRRDDVRDQYLDFVDLTCSPVGVGEVIKICLQAGDGCWFKHPNPPPGVSLKHPLGTPFITDHPTQNCPAGEAAVGIHGRSGEYVDALGLICGPAPKLAAAAAPLPPRIIKPLGKAKRITAARDDVDIYDGPGGNFRVIGMMRSGATALNLQYHADGWCKLAAVANDTDGWVAADHLTRCP